MNKKMMVLILIFLLGHGCSTTNDSFKKDESTEYKINEMEVYQSNTQLQSYFLPKLPKWINFSTSGNCERSSSIQYFDFEKLHQSFNLDFYSLIQLQLAYNFKSENKKLDLTSDILRLSDEQDLFYESLNEVNSDIHLFKKVKYKQVEVFWLEEFIKLNSKLDVLKRELIDKSLKGVLVLVSMCFTQKEMMRFLHEHNLEDLNIKLVSAEMFSAYNNQFKLTNLVLINLDFLFANNSINTTSATINFHTSYENIPPEIQGKVIKKKLRY